MTHALDQSTKPDGTPVTAAVDVPASGDRGVLAGEVNFAITDAAHHAFTRDLRRLTNTCATARAWTPETAATWATFKAQLGDPPPSRGRRTLAATVSRGRGAGCTRGPRCHGGRTRRIDPALDAVDAAFATADRTGLAESMWRLSAGLASHMRHEENETLPLVEQHLGRVGWAVFTTRMGSNASSLPPRSSCSAHLSRSGPQTPVASKRPPHDMRLRVVVPTRSKEDHMTAFGPQLIARPRRPSTRYSGAYSPAPVSSMPSGSPFASRAKPHRHRPRRAG